MNNPNNGLTVTFTNNTENTIGNYSQSHGIRYIWTFGDGDTQTVNVGSNQLVIQAQQLHTNIHLATTQQQILQVTYKL